MFIAVLLLILAAELIVLELFAIKAYRHMREGLQCLPLCSFSPAPVRVVRPICGDGECQV
jgi:hypothetical protein